MTPRGTVQPCVYWPGEGAPLRVRIERGPGVTETQPSEDARSLPLACRACVHVEPCHGGCAGRRRLHHELATPDF